MVEEGNVKGEMKFEKPQPVSEDFITKEETMFKVDEKGIAIPEKYPVLIYDRVLEEELINEGLLLMATLRKQDAINKTIHEENVKTELEQKGLLKKIESESDGVIKKQLKAEFELSKNISENEAVKTRVNHHVVEDTIKESRDIIRQLKIEKQQQMVKKFVNLIPCNTTESTFSFEKGRAVDGKQTDDWVADLISKKIVKPSFTIEEAKLIKPDFKIALKEAIMEASNYKVKNYRDVMMMEKMAKDRPLTLKKEKSIGENIAPAESAS